MRNERGVLNPRGIDRVMFTILAFLGIANGVYLVGPWYLPVTSDGKAPLYSLFEHPQVVTAFGALVLLTGLVLLYAAYAKATSRYYEAILSNALLMGFILRLYSLFGVFLTIDSWKPPTYLSHMATVFILGAYWVAVKVSVRTTDAGPI